MQDTQEQARICPLCNGSGVLEYIDGWGNYGTRKCRRCHGTGVVHFTPVRALWSVVILLAVAVIVVRALMYIL